MRGGYLSARAPVCVGVAAVVAVTISLLFAVGAGASPPGSETVDRSGTLATSGQSMWQAGSGGGPEDRRVTFFDKSWNASGSGGSITDVKSPTFKVCNIFKGKTVEKFFTEGSTSCEDEEEVSVPVGEFGAQGSAATKGEIGMSLVLHGFASGSVGVNYPVTARYTIPRPDSFAAGEQVTVETSETVDPGAALQTSFPTLSSAELDGIFGFQADANFNLCFFSCTGEKSLFDFSLPEGYDGSNPYSGKILEVSNPGTLCFDAIVSFIAGFGHAPAEYTRCHNPETGVNSGYLELPNVSSTSTLNGDGSLTAGGEDPYAVVPISAVTWAARMIPGKPPVPLNFGPTKIPGTSITLGWNTVQLLFTDIEKMRQEFAFKPRVDTTLSWGETLQYTVTGPHGETVGTGPGTAATFPLGDTLTLDTSSALRGSLTVTPHLSMSQADFSNHTENINIGSGEFSTLGLTLDTPSAEAEAFGHKFTAWPGTEINLGPLYKTEFPLAESSNDILDSSWTLGGFNQPQLGDLQLTPDPPPLPSQVTVHPVEGAAFTGTIASFTDPDKTGKASDYTAKIEWGDGSITEGATLVDDGEGVFHVTGTHTYAEEGSYAVNVTIQDDDTVGLRVTDESKAEVADAALHLTTRTDTSTTVGPALLWPAPPSSGTLASFTDDDPAGTLSDYTATIDWGDGAITTATIAPNAGGDWAVSGDHEYAVLGPHTATVTVRDAGGSEARATVELVVYTYTAGGDFTIESARAGDPVTFWGAQWSSDNPLVGASPSFKGWADSASTPPSCEGSWSSRPGNSSGPPVGVPSYVAVIETGAVAKHGSVLSGQADGVAVVRTEAGYGPDPGHAGTGAIVAQVCG